MTEAQYVVIGTERGDAAPIALLAREHPEALEYVGGAMVTLPDAERKRFWGAVDMNLAAKPPARLPKEERHGSSRTSGWWHVI